MTTDFFSPSAVDALLTTDQAALRGLSASEVRTWVVNRVSTYRKATHTLLAIYNSIAPIDALPDELLLYVFRECWINRASLRVAHVCRRWRAVALETREFWEKALSGDVFDFEKILRDERASTLPEYFQAALARSAPRPISLRMRHFPAHFAPRWLESHASRIVALDIKLCSARQCLDGLQPYLAAGLPSLEVLKVQFDCFYGDGGWSDMDSFRALGEPWWEWGLRCFDLHKPLPPTALPRLKNMQIPGLLFPSLASASLMRLKLFSPEPCHHFYEALGICTNLERLELATYVKPDAPQTLVHLPALKKVIVGMDYSPDAIASILQLPSFSPRKRLHIKGGNASLVHCLPTHSTNKLQALLAALDSVSVEELAQSAASTLMRGFSDRKECLSVNHRADASSSEDYIRIFRPHTSITHLSFVLTAGRRIRHPQDLFRAFPHLHSLHLRLDPDAPINFLTALKGRDDPSDARSLVCPALKRLQVWFDFRMTGELAPALRAPHSHRRVLEAHLRPRAALLAETLAHRAEIGRAHV